MVKCPCHENEHLLGSCVCGLRVSGADVAIAPPTVGIGLRTEAECCIVRDMKLGKIVDWLDKALSLPDVSGTLTLFR